MLNVLIGIPAWYGGRSNVNQPDEPKFPGPRVWRWNLLVEWVEGRWVQSKLSPSSGLNWAFKMEVRHSARERCGSVVNCVWWLILIRVCSTDKWRSRLTARERTSGHRRSEGRSVIINCEKIVLKDSAEARGGGRGGLKRKLWDQWDQYFDSRLLGMRESGERRSQTHSVWHCLDGRIDLSVVGRVEVKSIKRLMLLWTTRFRLGDPWQREKASAQVLRWPGVWFAETNSRDFEKCERSCWAKMFRASDLLELLLKGDGGRSLRARIIAKDSLAVMWGWRCTGFEIPWLDEKTWGGWIWWWLCSWRNRVSEKQSSRLVNLEAGEPLLNIFWLCRSGTTGRRCIQRNLIWSKSILSGYRWLLQLVWRWSNDEVVVDHRN